MSSWFVTYHEQVKQVTTTVLVIMPRNGSGDTLRLRALQYIQIKHTPSLNHINSKWCVHGKAHPNRADSLSLNT